MGSNIFSELFKRFLPAYEDVYNLVAEIQGLLKQHPVISSANIVIATDGKSPDNWGHQIGENPDGPCSQYRHWATARFTKDSDPAEVGEILLEQLQDSFQRQECRLY
tara:strand:- start:3496 stop:3816 length:321 start_codon:yes stop_codon:yes gene_type:complete